MMSDSLGQDARHQAALELDAVASPRRAAGAIAVAAARAHGGGQALLARTCSCGPGRAGTVGRSVTANIFAEVQFEKWCEIGGGRARVWKAAGQGPTMLNQPPSKSPKQQNSWKCKTDTGGVGRGRGLTRGVLWN